MVNSALQKKKATIFRSQELYSKRVSKYLLRKLSFATKCVITSKVLKLWKKILRTYVDLSLLNTFAKFLGKVTKEKQVRGKKNYLSINKLSFDLFSFKFRHLYLKFRSTLSLIMRIIKEKTTMDNIIQKSLL